MFLFRYVYREMQVQGSFYNGSSREPIYTYRVLLLEISQLRGHGSVLRRPTVWPSVCTCGCDAISAISTAQCWQFRQCCPAVCSFAGRFVQYQRTLQACPLKLCSPHSCTFSGAWRVTPRVANFSRWFAAHHRQQWITAMLALADRFAGCLWPKLQFSA